MNTVVFFLYGYTHAVQSKMQVSLICKLGTKTSRTLFNASDCFSNTIMLSKSCADPEGGTGGPDLP